MDDEHSAGGGQQAAASAASGESGQGPPRGSADLSTAPGQRTQSFPRLVSALKHAAYSPDGIWGAGDTPGQARAEAEGYLTDLFANRRDPALRRTLEGLAVAPISDELLALVVRFGAGYERFSLRDGVLVPAAARFSGAGGEGQAVDLLDD